MDTDEHRSERPTASAEISYDLVMGEQMSFVEGTYRLPGAGWGVFIFSRHDVEGPSWSLSTWDNGASGIVVRWPRSMALNQAAVERLLAAALGVTDWSRVRGPDSMALR